LHPPSVCPAAGPAPASGAASKNRLAHAVKRFAVQPKCWIVEGTIACLNRCRRLAKDGECLNRKALAILRLASIRRMLRKLCPPE